MNIHFFERKLFKEQISIEKLFEVLYQQLKYRNISFSIFKNKYPLSQFWKALFFFKNNQGDINHITGDIHWACLLLDRNKTVLTIHDLVGLSKYKGFKKFLYYLIWVYFPIKKLKYITAVSEKTKEEILQVIPSAKDKIHVIPNFVTMSILDDNQIGSNNVIKILIVGTRSNKNIERILNALVGINAEITIIGKLEQSHIDFIQERRFKINNYYNISDQELEIFYHESDILLFPSLYEGFGLPILEAQAQNCCVITSNISPMKEIAGEGALLVDPLSVDEISNAINTLSKNKEQRKELVRKGKENVLRYTPEEISIQYINLYNQILEK